MDARKALSWLVLAALVLLAGLWFANGLTDVDLSFFLNLSVGGFTALLGARIAMWIYAQLTRESQQRQFRHDLEVRHFEQIYGRLYEMSSQVVSELEAYGQPWLHKWWEIEKSSFGPFTEESIAEDLNSLNDKLRNLGDAWREGLEAFRVRLKKAIGGHSLMKGFSEDIGNQLIKVLEEDKPFLFDPNVETLPDHMHDRVANMLKPERPRTTPEEAEELGRYLKTILVKDPAVRERVSETETILPLAKAVHEKILRRMRDPFQPGGG